VDWHFRKLPARPLVRHDLQLDGLDADRVESAIRMLVAEAPADAVVSIRVTGIMTEQMSRVLSARFLRDLAPPTMNLDLRLLDGMDPGPRSWKTTQPDVLELPL
jgi:hypothetical protein